MQHFKQMYGNDTFLRFETLVEITNKNIDTFDHVK